MKTFTLESSSSHSNALSMPSPRPFVAHAPRLPGLTFGVDLITFFHPGFWGLDSTEQVLELGRGQPRQFWDRMLDTLEGTGIKGIELTFSPFGWEDSLCAYGSVDAFKAELDRRGLVLATGFFADVAIEDGLESDEVQARHIRRADAYAEYLAHFGVDIMVMGLPMRRSWNAEPPQFIGLEYMHRLADFCNRLGARTLTHGVHLALHTEAHSSFSQARDVDLLLLLTDPVYVGFCPDTAHLLISGTDPVRVAERHIERMLTAHWKDATGPAPVHIKIDAQIHAQHRPYFCALGDGQVDWRRWVELLRTHRFEGWAILELDAAADPRGEMLRSLDFVHGQLLPSAT
ncbi:MAG: sugar phosphate isomerase/epimerase [Pseudomonas sp.]